MMETPRNSGKPEARSEVTSTLGEHVPIDTPRRVDEALNLPLPDPAAVLTTTEEQGLSTAAKVSSGIRKSQERDPEVLGKAILFTCVGTPAFLGFSYLHLTTFGLDLSVVPSATAAVISAALASLEWYKFIRTVKREG